MSGWQRESNPCSLSLPVRISGVCPCRGSAPRSAWNRCFAAGNAESNCWKQAQRISYAQEGQFRFAESERIYEGGQSRASSKCYDYRKPSHIYDSLLDRGHRFGYRESAKQQRVPEP